MREYGKGWLMEREASVGDDKPGTAYEQCDIPDELFRAERKSHGVIIFSMRRAGKLVEAMILLLLTINMSSLRDNVFRADGMRVTV